MSFQDVTAPSATRGIGAHLLSDDLLEGADQIAAFLFGTPKKRRRVYHLAEGGRLPVFRIGALLCARKSKLVAWIEDAERDAVAA